MACKKKVKYTTSNAFRDLGKIDKAHEAKKITKKQHDLRSKKVLNRLVRNKRWVMNIKKEECTFSFSQHF